MSGNSHRIDKAANSYNALSNNELRVLEALEGIRYGAVEVTIHDGRIVQIERREKLRLDQPPALR
ncbi:YezD family protein [Methylogaea oryzae]|uniref:DUF2292 domain-containing protein n=1 Tax=Methylogaea oryzae TaxID=1295382 RepID=A0A8D5AMS3_9GAMM|nr:YezD family protein [Methylogaea oryzae]BBL71370.1 hypothetical protein MoryE10_19760 [Methylogaea oryzae]